MQGGDAEGSVDTCKIWAGWARGRAQYKKNIKGYVAKT